MASLTGAIGPEGAWFIAVFGSSFTYSRTVKTAVGATLIDTGATRSAVSDRIVNAMQLVPVDLGYVTTPGHQQPQPTYLYRLHLGIDTKGLPTFFQDFVVYGGVALGAIDCLLGRDVLDHGIFHYDGLNRMFTLSF